MPPSKDPAARFRTHPHMQRRWKAVGRKLAFSAKSRAALASWRRRLRAKLKELTGYDTMKRAPLRPRITESVEFEDHTRQRVEIQTEPGVCMPLYVLIPKGAAMPRPAGNVSQTSRRTQQAAFHFI